MRFYDTHCHFESADETTIAATVRRAREAGVEKMLAVGGSESLNKTAIAAAIGHVEDGVSCALGYDRDQIGVEKPAVSSLAKDGRFRLAAYGEIGLDYHYSPETRTEQLELFGKGLEEAAAMDLPVVVHTREADSDTLGMLRDISSRGIIHSCTASPETVRRFLDLGFYISFSGIVTFRLADNVRQSALVVPDDRILIETDSPYLAPVPMRGRENEPAFVRHTCAFLAGIRSSSVEDFAELTFGNAERILG